MADIGASIDQLVEETGFSGVVRADRDRAIVFARAYGLSNRSYGLPMTIDTRLATASATKGLTALTVVSLIDEGVFGLETTTRSVLGGDLPLIDDDVTVEHLLAHRSGIGDYFDEDVWTDDNAYVLPVPVHELATTEPFVPILDGFPQKFAPDAAFSYCNGGYVVLALIAERAAGVPYHDLVERRVLEPAGMTSTAFLRSDELPGDAAICYLAPDGLRSNVLHLPVRGNGDGGIYSTAEDFHALWDALFAGHIVPLPWVEQMVRPRSDVPSESMRYGLGFWLHPTGDAVILIGGDAGVSMRTVHDPVRGTTHTVISNTASGAWRISMQLDELMG